MRVLNLVREAVEDERIVDFHLDGPQAGDEPIGHALTTCGWVVAEGGQIDCVEFVYRGEAIGRARLQVERADVLERFPHLADAAVGWETQFSAMGLPAVFDIFVRVVFADGSRQSLATIHGERQPLLAADEVGFDPLIVTTYGRTGSTWLMHLFDQHPATLAYRPFSYEPRTISYWLSVLSALGAPASYLQPLATNLSSDNWWLGDASVPTELPRPDAAVEDQLARAGVEDVAMLCRERIRMFYEAAAMVQSKPKARYFVEKAPPQPWVRRLLDELFPAAREVILVRDFRDMACSILAYNEKMDVTSFGRERVDSDLNFIDELGKAANSLVIHRKRYEETAFVLRYEDLILDPEPTLTGLFDYLGVNSSPETIATMLERASRETGAMTAHRTTGDARASVGRWKQDMSPALQEKCAESLDNVLGEFGYEPTRAALG